MATERDGPLPEEFDTTSHVSTSTIDVEASPDDVFDVLDDPYAYARWVVGTRRIRGVDDEWPAIGARFFHAIGVGAAELHDWSRIRARERPRRLVLDVRFRPTGTAAVTIEVVPAPGGARVMFGETPISGPAALLPAAVVRPLLGIRNGESLRRLRREIERRRAHASVRR